MLMAARVRQTKEAGDTGVRGPVGRLFNHCPVWFFGGQKLQPDG